MRRRATHGRSPGPGRKPRDQRNVPHEQPGWTAAKDLIMQINTSRFGQVEIDDLRVITFSKGILGF
ncbi:MAG: hypothetical protein IT441_10040, partial [Phycisphaeraceae bacterium]|nr:hypothetical protein [Phycisphaeraceae bacterium]